MSEISVSASESDFSSIVEDEEGQEDVQTPLPVPVAVRPPKASEHALDYLQRVVATADFNTVMFDDKLVTVSDTGSDAGEYSVSIAPARHHGHDSILVHGSCRGAVQGVPCGASVVCHVSKRLETLEQHHNEYVKLEKRGMKRKTSVVKQEDGSYLVNMAITEGEAETSSAFEFAKQEMQGYISEGANMLLQRLMITCKHLPAYGRLQFVTLDPSANLCPLTYRTLQERQQTVEGREQTVYGLERTLHSDVNLPLAWQSYFFFDGHLSHRAQTGSPIVMTVQTMPKLTEKPEERPLPEFGRKQLDWVEDLQLYSRFLDNRRTAAAGVWQEAAGLGGGPAAVFPLPGQAAEERPLPEFGRKQLDWEEDLQLYSRFLDRREELKNSHMVYLRHHPDLRALLADYLQFLLLQKPADTIAFTTDYFTTFSAALPKMPSHPDSSRPPPYPHCCSNPRIEELMRVMAV